MQADLDWMYASGIDIMVESPYSELDSGWCDMGTGHQIITGRHTFTALVRDDKQDTWLKLYWENRATQIAEYKYDTGEETCSSD
jgi:hypothetical protein